jgi:tRNA pseudouridine38-40 synthase
VPRFRLTLEYDGLDFEGWQIQPGGRRTVQGTLEDAIERVTARRVRVTGAGRTDAGVHAEGQVASVWIDARLDVRDLLRSLNGVLPPDVAAVSVGSAPDGFDARRDARSKLYRYRIWNGSHPSPLRARRALCLERPLDVGAMRRAARALVGAHDFASFRAAGSTVETTVRTIFGLAVAGAAGAEILLLVEGDGFLRRMVRALVGTLVEVGAGRRPSGSMPTILAGRDRRAAGPTAPARALTLVRVSY